MFDPSKFSIRRDHCEFDHPLHRRLDGRRRNLGNLSGYVSPYMIGAIRDSTHSMTLALLALSACQLTACGLTLYVTRQRNPKKL